MKNQPRLIYRESSSRCVPALETGLIDPSAGFSRRDDYDGKIPESPRHKG